MHVVVYVISGECVHTVLCVRHAADNSFIDGRGVCVFLLILSVYIHTLVLCICCPSFHPTRVFASPVFFLCSSVI